MSVTLKDVAKEANVSYATVSRALSGNPHINKVTRERILKICDDMGYTTNFIARSMVRNKTEVLGLVVPGINNSYMAECAYYAEKCARENGYNMMLCNSDPGGDQEMKVVKLLIGRRVDGLLIVPQSKMTYEHIKNYIREVPTVFISANLWDCPVNYVSVDNTEGAYMGTKYLFNLNHRKIVYFGKRNNNTHNFRAEGYEKACAEYGVTPRIISSDYPNSSIENGYAMAKKLFENPVDYTAVFAATDSNAIGLMKAAGERNIRIPRDLSLIGFDNIPSSGYPRIELTTVEQPKKAMAVEAVRILIEKIESDESGENGYTHQILIPKLIKRSTCREIDLTE